LGDHFCKYWIFLGW
jgi:hypothetical protein